MPPPLLLLRDIHLTFGGTPLLEGAELSVSEGERLCLVGRNGSGKSTLMKIATGQIEADDGERFVQPGATLRYLPQEPELSGFDTIADYVQSGLETGDNPKRASILLDRLGLSGGRDIGTLSGGEVRRAALARALAPQPDILLLDEPTNHLDLPVIEWLEKELSRIRSALVLISHDRRFLEKLSHATLWINQGRTHRIDRGFVDFETWRENFLETEALERHKLDRKIAAETEWLHKGVTARRKRNMGRLRALINLRAKRRNDRGPTDVANMVASEAEISGKRVCHAKEISKSFDGRVIVDCFSTLIGRGDRVGIVGPNGAGKTTLLKLLTGELNPDSGHIRLGKNLEVKNLDQQRTVLKPGDTLAHALTGGGDKVTINGETRHVIGYMKDFLFTPNQARTPVTVLSGGERGRIMLARAFASPSNLLVLDEPTNDLDLETLDLLQELLADYAGTVLLVSHDRDFLDRVVTSVIAGEGNGKWTEYAGGYSDMLTQRGSKLIAQKPHETSARKNKAADPARVKYKKPNTGKLTFKDQHALDNLPRQIEELRTSIDTYRKLLADSGLFTKNPEKFSSTAKALQQTEDDLATAEDQWLQLEMKREALESK
ncbi:MAG: ATP-binding cassette domain-containing protein [Pseudomonadota bacterium]|nr:ATP-binding cassette domain-containing protein [Pseudomonadota bacterium]